MTAALGGLYSPSKRAPPGSADFRSCLDSATSELRLLRSEVSQHDPRISGLASQVSDVTLKISAEHERGLVDLKASLQDQKRSIENLGTHLSRLAMQTTKRMTALEEDHRQNSRQLASRLEALEAQDSLEVLSARLARLEAKSCYPPARVEELPCGPLDDRGVPEGRRHEESSPPPRRSITWDSKVGYSSTPLGDSMPASATPTPLQKKTVSWDQDAQLVHTWSTHQTHVLCDADKEATIEGKAPRLDQFSSVSEAVEQLNFDLDLCPGGFCVVLSARQGRYVLVFRSDKQREAFASFDLDLEVKDWNARDSAGISPAKLSTSPKGDGSLFKSLMGRLNVIVSDKFAAKPAAFNPSKLVMTHAANLGDRYEVLRQLGAGVQGTTHLVRRKNTGVEYVVKETVGDGTEGSDDLMMEFQKLQELRHPNCVKVIELLQGKQGKAFVILEYARGGDLYKYMQVALEQTGLTEDLIAGIFKQAMQGVAYLHTQDCVHNDLKPDNLLCLDEYDPKKVPRCVITDYGCARFIKTEQRFKFGDPRYQAPENLKSMMTFMTADTLIQVDMRPKGDVWSMGATLYELLSGGVLPFLYDRCPLQSLEDNSVFERLQSGILSQDEVVLQPHCSDVSEAAEGVLRMLLQKDEEARPTAQTVLSNPWFKTKTRRRMSAVVARHVEFTAVKDQARQILLNAVTARLQNEHMQASQEIFRRFDTENMGKITREGFKKALEGMHQDTTRADEIFDSADINGDGTLEFNEFAAMTFDWRSMDAQTLDSHIQGLLDDLSADGRGTVKESELAKLFGDSVKAEELKSLFSQIDSQNVGQLSKTEVRCFLQQQRNSMPAISFDMTTCHAPARQLSD